MPDGRTALIQSTPAGNVVIVPATTNAAQTVWFPPPISPQRDPAWEALRALGPKAVPHLVQYLRIGVMDRTYERVFTNLPAALQGKLPNPWQKKWLRIRAIDALAKLGDPAREAATLLLQLLKQRDPSLRRAVLGAIRGLHVDRRAITAVLLQLGSQRKYADVIEIAESTGWEGEEMVRLLGTILQSPDTALRRGAMTLLERAGPGAMPALEQITAALKDPDSEVRYLASRSLESIGTNSSHVVAALRTCLQDENVMVRNAATRTLTNITPDPVQPEKADAGKD
jgi:HEAT repeat protein